MDEPLPPYGDPESPVIAKLVTFILLDAIKKGVRSVQLELRHEKKELVVLHGFDIGEPQETMTPPFKLWLVIKHRLLDMAGLTDDPQAGWRTEPYSGAFQLSFESARKSETFDVAFEPTEFGERLLLRRG